MALIIPKLWYVSMSDTVWLTDGRTENDTFEYAIPFPSEKAARVYCLEAFGRIDSNIEFICK